MVSEMPPDTTAPMVRRIFASIATAIGMAIGIIIENVPQLVPVLKAMIAPRRKIIAGPKAPLTLSDKTCQDVPVPSVLITEPIAKANTKKSPV